MRNTVVGIVIALAATACASPRQAPLPPVQALAVHPTDSPFVRVVSGGVSGLVPLAWEASVAGITGSRGGFTASPKPHGWQDRGAPVRGISATWVDATQIGVPSDFYYLAASGPLLSSLIATPGCRAVQQRVFTDNLPTFAAGEAQSPGDFVARGSGVCRVRGAPKTRWSYFVAAPGFGPARQLGIPGSGLYVVTAITRDSPSARSRLAHLLAHVRFGETRLSDFVRATRQMG